MPLGEKAGSGTNTQGTGWLRKGGVRSCSEGCAKLTHLPRYRVEHNPVDLPFVNEPACYANSARFLPASRIGQICTTSYNYEQKSSMCWLALYEYVKLTPSGALPSLEGPVTVRWTHSRVRLPQHLHRARHPTLL